MTSVRKMLEGVRRAEIQYGVNLRRIARHIGDFVTGYDFDQPDAMFRLEAMLRNYGNIIEPWARNAAQSMLADVSRRDAATWQAMTKEMGFAVRELVQTAPVGIALQKLMQEQVGLITSIPLVAADRVHKLSQEALSTGERYGQISDMILNTGGVTKSRATLIARTEVARAHSTLTMVRATHVGSPGYIWRTVHDPHVRESHKEMEGQYIEWNKAPTLSDGTTTHAGMIYNCRCFAEPVIPDIFD